MRIDIGEEQGVQQADGAAGGGGGKVEIANPLLGAIPPGARPQINLEAAGRSADAEPFLAPTPQRNGTILGYGHARVGRVPPHGGSPSIGPLTGLPLRALRPPPVPPSYRRKALEPGHQEPDPFRRVPAIEVDPRAPGEALAEGLERLERSAAAVRSVPGPRRGGAGRHRPVAAAAGPAGAGGAQVAASLGVPAAESVRTSGRGVYVAGRASGARWEADASVKPRGAGGADPCVTAGKRGRPLTPLQSVKRYVRQQAAPEDGAHDASGPGTYKAVDIQPSGADSVARYASKAVSPAFKAFGKARMPGPVTAKEMAGKQEDPTPRLDAEQERRMLALHAQVSGLAGRFGARRRCMMDQTEALRPAPGHVEWRREQEPMRTEPGGRAGSAPSDANKSQGLARRRDGGPDAAGLRGDGACEAPQKYPARAGVAMRESAAADASEAAPPGGPGPAQADEGIPSGRQAPPGQQAYPPQDGADSRARDEAGPGAAAGPGPSGAAVVRRPEIAAQGMGGPSAPVLLGIDRAFRQEANARIDAQNAARALRTAFEDAGKAARQAMESARLVLKNAPLSDEMKLAAQRMPPAEAASFVIARMREFGEQARKADEERLIATALLSLVGEAAKQAAARHEELRRQQGEIRERGRALGNMDDATLRRRALEAGHRAERDSYRAERRALRRERGGVFMTRQFAEVAVASERAFDHEKRAARHQAQAEKARPGSSAQARAQREADYHGSLAEAGRHRASAARSHILGPEIARAKGVKEFLAAERARSDQIYREARELAELNRFRAVHEPKLQRVDARIDVLAEKNPDGSPKKVGGKYVAKKGKDQHKIDSLQREQDRLVARISKKLGSPGGAPGARTWGKIWNLWPSTGQPAAAQPSGPFAGTPEGHLIAALREPGLPPNLRVLVEAQVNSMMSEVIADASARSEAAFQAGMDAGLAQYDPKLNDAQRKEAAASHAAAVAAAAQDVAEIEDAIATKRENGAYFESGWGEHDEDQKKLEEAKRRLAALLDVCNNHPACADKKRECDAQSNSEQTCKLGPPASGGGGGEGGDGEEEGEDGGAVAGGEGTSISSADASAPGGGAAVGPQGGKETDGKDEPEGEKKEDGKERKDEKAVGPSEAKPDERPTIEAEKDPERKKADLPEFEWPDVGQVLRGLAGTVTTFARRVGGMIEEAAEDVTVFFRDVAEEAEKVEKARKAEEEKERKKQDAYIEQELKRIERERIVALRKLAVMVAAGATREEAIAAAREVQARMRDARRALRARIDELTTRMLTKDLPRGIQAGTLEYELWLLKHRGKVVTVRRTDAEDRELDRLLVRDEHLRLSLESFEQDEWRLSRSTEFDAPQRLSIGERLRAEQQALLDLDLDQVRNRLRGQSRKTIDEELGRLDQRMRWANLAAEHASLAILGVQQEEADRNGLLGSARHAFARWKEGNGYVDWAEAAAGSFTSHWRPDFDRADPATIEAQLRGYGDEIAGFRGHVRSMGAEIEKIASRTRIAAVLFAAAAVTAVFAASIAAVGAAATLGASWTGAGLGGAQSILRQGFQLIDDPGREFSGREVLQGTVFGAALGPLVEAVPPAGVVLGGVAVGSAAQELVEGDLATAAFDFLSAAVPVGITAARVRGGPPLQPGEVALTPEFAQPAPRTPIGTRLSSRAGLTEAEKALAGSLPVSAEAPAGSRAYSVFYETTLARTSYPGRSRARHFQEASESLLRGAEADAAFLSAMKQQGITLQRTPSGLAPRASPPDWSWHHAMEPGVMQLVPRVQHTPGSRFWRALHPEGSGGYAAWGQ